MEEERRTLKTLVLCKILMKSLKLKRNQERRKYRVHPIWTRRSQYGAHNLLVKEMVLFDQLMFMNYTRMSVENYEDLLLKVGRALESFPTRTDIISASEKLMVTLRYLATGETFVSLSRQFRMGVSTIQQFVRQTLVTLWQILKPEFLALPSTMEEWLELIHEFDKLWQFPNCFGAIDGKHVRIQAPQGSGSEYFNYKDFHSIVLMGMCDAKYNFTMIDVGGKGRQSDGGVFKNTNFYKKLQEKSLNLPPSTPLYPGGPSMPQVYIGDAAFELSKSSLRPFPGVAKGMLSKDQLVFNYRLSRARRTIENAFGILVARWKIFKATMNVDVETVKLIVLATICLHNFLKKKEKSLPDDARRYCPKVFADHVDDNNLILGEWRKEEASLISLEPVERVVEDYSKVQIMNHFKDYFMGVGRVPWQDAAVFDN